MVWLTSFLICSGTSVTNTIVALTQSVNLKRQLKTDQSHSTFVLSSFRAVEMNFVELLLVQLFTICSIGQPFLFYYLWKLFLVNFQSLVMISLHYSFLFKGVLYHLTEAITRTISLDRKATSNPQFLNVITRPLTHRIIQVRYQFVPVLNENFHFLINLVGRKSYSKYRLRSKCICECFVSQTHLFFWKCYGWQWYIDVSAWTTLWINLCSNLLARLGHWSSSLSGFFTRSLYLFDFIGQTSSIDAKRNDQYCHF